MGGLQLLSFFAVSCSLYRKIYNLTEELTSQVMNSPWTANVRISRFIYVCVNVAVFNARSREAIPVESTVKNVSSQRKESTFKKTCVCFLASLTATMVLKIWLQGHFFLTVFKLLICYRYSKISRKASFSRVAIPCSTPRLGNQSGCKNFLSYVILNSSACLRALYELGYLTAVNSHVEEAWVLSVMFQAQLSSI